MHQRIQHLILICKNCVGIKFDFGIVFFPHRYIIDIGDVQRGKMAI